MCEDMLLPSRELDPEGIWKSPDESNISYLSYLKHIENLPLTASPVVYGLHPNADITKDQQETTNMLSSILLIQRGGGGSSGGQDKENTVREVVNEIRRQIPDDYDIEVTMRTYPIVWAESMNTVLIQELMRYNKLIGVVRNNLEQCLKAIEGLVVMNEELQSACDRIFFGKIPTQWMNVSYPSLKSLGNYISDLLQRLSFFRRWVDEGAPPAFWISGFYFTQSFLTGALQNYARKFRIPIDQLDYDFQVLKSSQEELISSTEG